MSDIALDSHFARRPTRRLLGDPVADDIVGSSRLGMAREALRAARRALRAKVINGVIFEAALDAVLSHGSQTRLRGWRPVVEAAHARLGRKAQRDVRFLMLCYHDCCGDYARAEAFLPRRIDFSETFAELAFAMDAWVALGRTEQLERYYPALVKLAPDADNEEFRGHLCGTVAQYAASRQRWDDALSCYQAIPDTSASMEEAILGPVKVRAAQALATARTALARLHQLRHHTDPVLDTTLPGNFGERRRRTEKELQRVVKRLGRVLGKKGLRDMGFEKSKTKLDSGGSGRSTTSV